MGVGRVLNALLAGLGAVCVIGGIPLLFVKAKESAETSTLWPVGVVFLALGAFCLLVLWLVNRGPKVVFDDVGVHSHAVFGKHSVHWEHIEKVQPVRGYVWITAPGGIHNKAGKVTRKKTIQFNARGLACGVGGFVHYLDARLRNGGRAPQ